MNKIKRIIITTDVLRDPECKDFSLQSNTVWTSTLFGDLCNEVTGLPIEVYDAKYMNGFVQTLYKIYGFTDKIEQIDWLKIYNQTELEPLAKELFHVYFSDSLVIGFELPQIFRRMFDNLGIFYIDIIHHPIRYLDDLLHGFSTNSLAIYNKLMKYQINPDIFKLQATYLKVKSRMRNINNNKIIPNSCIIFGQTNVDRSILKPDGSLARILDYKEQIIELSKKYKHIYFKPHPLNVNNKETIEFLKSNISNFSLLDYINAYDLYCNDSVELYIALSSGSLYEAKYFGNNVQYLYKQPFEYGEDYINKSTSCYDWKEVFVSIYKNYLSYAFWSDILSEIISVKSKDSICIDTHNIMRHALRANWSYNDNNSFTLETFMNSVRYDIASLRSSVQNKPIAIPKGIGYKIWKHLNKKLKKQGII
ncbi:MAG: hypothetical protein E7012_01745 [Alphaproteobacteria bacterium]|nr:hypothetical protein [Alphaproteobacteria bacterium]